jgi:transcriptional repressor NrdR
VYQAFESLEDFETAISLLRHESDREAKAAEAETAKGAPSSEKSSL